MKNLLFLTLAILLVACSDDEEKIVKDFLDCEAVADSYMPYEGGEIQCEFHYILGEYDGRDYIELNSHCADLARAFVIDDTCIDICDPANNTPSECEDYLANRETKEVILIAK